MSTSAPLRAGIDLGSTAFKLLITDEGGTELVSEQVATPWLLGAHGAADLPVDRLLSSVNTLMTAAAHRLDALHSPPVGAIGISGMGESGFLVDPQGQPVAPAFAWFDPRGAAQVAAFPAPVRTQFAGRTGLPLGTQVTVAKIALLRDGGVDLAGLRWLNLPEFVATALGARAVSEYSLASRTGLLDQDTGLAWRAMADHLGVDDDFLPPLVASGEHLGTAGVWLPERFAGAAITVAGHDHLVAAESSGPIPDDHYYVSLGTAEVLLRVLDRPLGYEARARLASMLINEVRHIVPGKRVLVAGCKSGLLLRRALQLTGVRDRASRGTLDDEVMALPVEGTLPEGGIAVSGARNDDGVLKLELQTDDVNPAELFGAVLRHSNAEITRLISAIDQELPAANSSTLTGGWADMKSVQRARSRVLPSLSISQRQQETAFGAAQIAARLLTDQPLV